MASSSLAYLLLTITTYVITQARAQTQYGSSLPILSPSTAQGDWDALNSSTGGRLFNGVPFVQPCFFQSFNSSACMVVRTSYLDEVSRSNIPSAYIQTQWETCQATGDQCLLDYSDTGNVNPTLPPNQCKAGSVPSYFIDVRLPGDVSAAFKFSEKTNTTLVIKNTGHDYKGRSSAPNSLALWTHNLKNMSYNPQFTPEGCSTASAAVTVGAGVQWREAYNFADANNITLVGGSDITVGVAGGWLQGGGHSALSNTMGLGVDRVLEFKVVTPDGQFRTANACQNEDLFFALRGGGGGTFGVVLESTILASPRVTLQAVILSFTPTPGNSTLNSELWTILSDNGLTWANEGWGGFSASGVAILINPNSTTTAAAASMAPLIVFGQRLIAEKVPNAQLVVTEFPSWKAFFDVFTSQHVAVTGTNLALASSLVNKINFMTTTSRSALVSALVAAETATPGMIILISAPSSYPSDGTTSVTDAWRQSLYHVTVVSLWNWNATQQEKKAHYNAVSNSIDNLRKISPGPAAYQNEADVYEPNHEVAFWGTHYPRLLQIKNKYDPNHLLDCWHCVGWNPTSSRFSCYL